jgi:hypothetical protein
VLKSIIVPRSASIGINPFVRIPSLDNEALFNVVIYSFADGFIDAGTHVCE